MATCMAVKKSHGQYFTKNKLLQRKVCEFILNDPLCILEPSIGRGDLVEAVSAFYNPRVQFDMYEIDESISLLPIIEKERVVYGDFLNAHLGTTKYKTIIGNPPYVRQKLCKNLYIQFIEKCFGLLEAGGELIFIVPTDFFKLTSAAPILTYMMKAGTFTHVFHPNNEKLFENANIDVMIFRYCKCGMVGEKTNKTVFFNGTKMLLTFTNGIIGFSKQYDADDTVDSDSTQVLRRPKRVIGDYFDCFVGMVTGKEIVFKSELFGNISMLVQPNKITKYIYLTSFPTENHELNQYMESHKQTLMERKIRKFSEKNWFEWGAPRNKSSIDRFMGQEAVFVRNVTRQKVIAFKDRVQYFGGSLLMLLPKKRSVNEAVDSTDAVDVDEFVEYLNSDDFKSNYTYSGRFKIGHKQLCSGLF